MELIINLFRTVFNQIGYILGFILVIGYILGIFLLHRKEKEIFKLKYDIDHIEEDAKSKQMIHSGYFSQGQFEKRIEIRRKPMEAQLETLKLSRQYLLDKIPLLSFFKK
jgi:hypothetical protein